MSNPPTHTIDPRDRNRAVIAGFLGWTLDAFDFALVTFTADAIASDLGVKYAAVMWSVALTMAGRPLGAIIFGLLADRYGRRTPLMINLVFYSLIEVLTGFSNNITTFLLLRFLFGIGMGGEWGVGASLMMEKISPKYRGMLSGLLQEGYACGALLASIAYGTLFPHIGNLIPGFSAWRTLFFIGGLPALLALFVRFGIKESEVWKSSRSENWSQLFSVIAKHWKTLLFLIILMSFYNCASHGTQDLYPGFLKLDWGLKDHPHTVMYITSLNSIGAILGGIVVGMLSDRIGRRRAIIAAFTGAILCIPLWAFAPMGNFPLLMLGGFLMQFMVQGAWGVVPAHLSELAPDAARGFLPGFGYQCGALISGSLPALQEILAEHHGRAFSMAITCALVFLGAILVVFLGAERKGIHFGRSHH
jgi:SHS family lactate transporter-like MFS transporter